VFVEELQNAKDMFEKNMKHAPVPSAFASRRGLLKTSRLGVGERVVAGFIGRRSRHLFVWTSKKVF
jgi:hypothetical protein